VTKSDSAAAEIFFELTASSRIGSVAVPSLKTVGGTRSVGMYTRAMSTRRWTSIVS
jgi:hypothetical protein